MRNEFKKGDKRYLRQYDMLGNELYQNEWALLTYDKNGMFFAEDGMTWEYRTEARDEDLFTVEEYENYTWGN